jgi:hypothetical protein
LSGVEHRAISVPLSGEADPGREKTAGGLIAHTHRASPLSDPKPERRISNPLVFRRFHDAAPDCLACGYRHVQAHHLISRGRGGDDVLENLIPLCTLCHGALHTGRTHTAYGHAVTQESVLWAIGRFLVSEAGTEHVIYVLRKLGPEAGIAFLERFGFEQ